MKQVPESRIRELNEAPLRSGGSYVLYWMIAARRAQWNFGLDRALELAGELGCGVIVLEALRADYPWANARTHRFVIDGMADNARAFEGSGVLYYPYVEPEPGAGRGLLAALAERACAVVTDDYPIRFLARMAQAAARDAGVRFEAVDSNGILPMRVPDVVFARAFDFRRYLQRELRPYLEEAPRAEPLRVEVEARQRMPSGIVERWPAVDEALLEGGDAGSAALAGLPIDQDVGPVAYRGGSRTGRRELGRFLKERPGEYGEGRNQPEAETTSGLSPYLHFGHVASHEVLARIQKREDWSLERLSESTAGKRSGWWGMGAAAEGFLDQLVTWRELGFNMCAQWEDYDRYDWLPAWAQTTLAEHAGDPRPHLYGLEEFEAARTHDELWNAAQNQLRIEGRIHNYLRMLWGKKILHWSATPEEALETMIHLNNKYALDGRDPNSYSGIFWVLGRYDRPWGPEREVFGKVRYMTSDNTRRKFRVEGYLERFAERTGTFDFG